MTGGILVGGQLVPGAISPATAQSADAMPAPLDVLLRVNGADHRLTLDPRTTLLDALREHLRLTGTKKGCGLGQCGACTVLMDGKRVNRACRSRRSPTAARSPTIEGLAQGGQLHPLQAAFIEHDAFQCGYCTPGQIMAGVACIAEGHAGSARGDPRLDERQPVPLRRLRPHRRGDSGCGARRWLRAGGLSHAPRSPSNGRATWRPRSLCAPKPAATMRPPNTSPAAPTWCSCCRRTCAGPSGWSSLAGLPRRPHRRRAEGPAGIGAAATMADVAAHPRWSSSFP